MKYLSLAIVLLLSSIAYAQINEGGPDLGIPAELKPTTRYLGFKPKTEAKAITYIGMSGVDPLPAEFLKDPRWFLLDVSGLKAGRYVFIAVGSLDDVHTAVQFTVVIGEPGPGPDPDPDPTPTPELDALGRKSFLAANVLPSIARTKCKAVAAAYRDVIKRAEGVESGFATVTEIQNKLSAARAEAQGDPAAWGPWNTVIKAEWDNLWLQSAGQVNKSEVLKFHKSVASGLEAVK